MDFISSKFIIEWLVVIGLFLFGIYTMLVIKNEKKTYLKNAIEKTFNGFKLLVPSWWGEIQTNDTGHLMFKRLDTRYEWEAHFYYIPKTDNSFQNQSIQEALKEKLENKKLLFDADTTIITNPSDFRDRPLLTTGLFELCRVEGTATMDRTERTYYDAFMVRHLQTGDILFCESKSSVLNGLVEGPFFEEVIERLEWINKN